MQVHLDYRKRIEGFQARLRERGVDVLVGTRLNTVTHISGGFVPWRSAVVVPAEGGVENVRLVTLLLDYGRLAQESWLTDVVMYGGPGMMLMDVVAQAVREKGCAEGTVGIESGSSAYLPDGFITLEEHESLRALLPKAKLVNANDVIERATLIKEPGEIALLQQAAAICDMAQEAVAENLHVGITEQEIAAIAEGVMREAGSEFGWSFTGGQEVASGYRTAYPLGGCTPATGKRVQRGEPVLVDLHAMYGLMLGDVAHNYVLGEPSGELSEVIEAYTHTSNYLVAEMQPGRSLGEVAQAVASFVGEHGWSEWVLPGYGHGIGHFGHEWYPCVMQFPIANNTQPDYILEPGYVQEIAIVCNRPGVGGFRLERPLLVTETGNRLLSATDIEPKVIDI
ncbi:MAG: aminopeptidase P family protein [Bacillota bacterium]|nr:MAG: aminopeptidase P family protein [Bacillota bacterium]